MEWQPIETAPRNEEGELILAYVPLFGPMIGLYIFEDEVPRCPSLDTEVYYDWGASSNAYFCQAEMTGFGSFDVDFDIEHRPTHWMPLPEPPK